MQSVGTADSVNEKESFLELVIQNKDLTNTFFENSSDEDSDYDYLSEDCDDHFN